MTRLIALGLAAAALGGCELLGRDFSLSGRVELSSELAARAPKAAMLFLIAENAGGVPVAIHRIVNPDFPARFRMGPHDLLIPALRRGETLRLRAELNTHGDMGKPRSGDLEGALDARVAAGAADLRLVLDKQR